MAEVPPGSQPDDLADYNAQRHMREMFQQPTRRASLMGLPKHASIRPVLDWKPIDGAPARGQSSGGIVLDRLFVEFTRVAGFVIGHVTDSGQNSIVEAFRTCSNREEFTQYVHGLSALCDKGIRLKALVDLLLQWRKGLGVPDEVTKRPSSPLPLSKGKRSPDEEQERQHLVTNFLFCTTLVEVLQDRTGSIPHQDVKHLLGLCFQHFVLHEAMTCASNGKGATEVARKFAEVLGIISRSSFIIVAGRLSKILEDPSHDVPAMANFIHHMEFLHIKLYPVTELDACFQFLQKCAEHFRNPRCKTELRHAWARLFVNILLPIAGNAETEVNVPAVRQFVQMMYEPSFELSKKSKHINAMFPLLTALLCLSQKDFFLKHWVPFLQTCLSNVKSSTKPIARIALDSVSRLVWVYMIRIKGEDNTTTEARVRLILDALFPPHSKGLATKEGPIPVYVRILIFIARTRLDFAMNFIMQHLLRADVSAVDGQASVKNMQPERTTVALRAILLITNNLEDTSKSVPLPVKAETSTGTENRAKTLLSTDTLSSDQAISLGFHPYMKPIRTQLALTLQALDAHYMASGQTLLGTAPPPAPDKAAVLDLFRTCLVALPRFFDESLEHLIPSVLRATIHTDHEVRKLASAVLQCILRNHMFVRNTIPKQFAMYVAMAVPLHEANALHSCLRIFIYLLRQWSRTLRQERQASPPDTSSRVVGSDMISSQGDLLEYVVAHSRSQSRRQRSGNWGALLNDEPTRTASPTRTTPSTSPSGSPRQGRRQISKTRAKKLSLDRQRAAAEDSGASPPVATAEEKTVMADTLHTLEVLDALCLVLLLAPDTMSRKLALVLANEADSVLAELRTAQPSHEQLASQVTLASLLDRLPSSCSQLTHVESEEALPLLLYHAFPSKRNLPASIGVDSPSPNVLENNAIKALLSAGPSPLSIPDPWTTVMCKFVQGAVEAFPKTKALVSVAWTFAHRSLAQSYSATLPHPSTAHKSKREMPQTTPEQLLCLRALARFLFSAHNVDAEKLCGEKLKDQLNRPSPLANPEPQLLALTQVATAPANVLQPLKYTFDSFVDLLLDMLQSPDPNVRKVVLAAAASLRPESYPLFAKQIETLFRSSFDLKTDRSRTKKRRDALRQDIACVFHAVATPAAKCCDTSSCPAQTRKSVTDFLSLMRSYLELDTVGDQEYLHSMQLSFCGFISDFVTAMTNQELTHALFDDELRTDLFFLLIKSTPWKLRSSDPEPSSPQSTPSSPASASSLSSSHTTSTIKVGDDLKALHLEATKALSALVRAGPLFDESNSMSGSAYLKRLWLQVFKSPEPEYWHVSQLSLTGLLRCNATSPSIVSWVLDLCYSGAEEHTRVAALCAVAAVLPRSKALYAALSVSHWLCLAMAALASSNALARGKARDLLHFVITSSFPDFASELVLFSSDSSVPSMHRDDLVHISTELAKRHPEIALAMTFHLMMRFGTSAPEMKHVLLLILHPWLSKLSIAYVQEQVFPKSRTNDVVSAVIRNLIVMYSQHSEQFSEAFLAAWQALAQDAHLTLVIVQLLVDEGKHRRTDFLATAKGIVVTLLRCMGDRLVQLLLHDATGKGLVHWQGSTTDLVTTMEVATLSLVTEEDEPDSSSACLSPASTVDSSFGLGDQVAYMLPFDQCLPVTHADANDGFNVSLVYLVEVLRYAPQYDWRPHLTELVTPAFLCADHQDPMVQQHCKQLLVNFTKSMDYNGRIPAYKADLARTLLEDLEDTVPLWMYEDVVPGNVMLSSENQVVSWVQRFLTVFSDHDEASWESDGSEDGQEHFQPLQLKDAWNACALRWATTSEHRHSASRAFQIVRAINAPFIDSSLSLLLMRLADVVEDPGFEAQGYTIDILLTLKHIVSACQTSEYTHGLASILLSRIFWTCVSLLESSFAHEFEMAVDIMHDILAVPLFEERVCQSMVNQLLQDLEWEGDFRGVHELVLKGLTLDELLVPTLNLLVSLATRLDNRIIDSTNALCLNVLVMLPLLMSHFDEEQLPDLAHNASSTLSQVLEGVSSRLSKVFGLYAQRQYQKTRADWVKDFATYYAKAFFPRHDFVVFGFLVALLEKGSVVYRMAVVEVMAALLRTVNPKQMGNIGLMLPELVDAIVRLEREQLWEEAHTLTSALSFVALQNEKAEQLKKRAAEGTPASLGQGKGQEETGGQPVGDIGVEDEDGDDGSGGAHMFYSHGQCLCDAWNTQKNVAVESRARSKLASVLRTCSSKHLRPSQSIVFSTSMTPTTGQEFVTNPSSPSTRRSSSLIDDSTATLSMAAAAVHAATAAKSPPGDAAEEDVLSADENELVDSYFAAYSFLDEELLDVKDMTQPQRRASAIALQPTAQASPSPATTSPKQLVSQHSTVSESSVPAAPSIASHLHSESVPRRPSSEEDYLHRLTSRSQLNDFERTRSLSSSTRSLDLAGFSASTSLEENPDFSMFTTVVPEDVDAVWSTYLRQAIRDQAGQVMVQFFWMFEVAFRKPRAMLCDYVELMPELGIDVGAMLFSSVLQLSNELRKLQLPFVYVDTETLTHTQLLPQLQFYVTQISAIWETLAQQLDDLSSVMSGLKQASVPTARSSRPASPNIGGARANVLVLASKVQNTLVLLLDLVGGMLWTFERTPFPSVIQNTTPLLQTALEMIDSAVEQHTGTEIRRMDYSLLNKPRALQSLQGSIEKRQLPHAIGLLHGFRQNWENDVFGASEDDDAIVLKHAIASSVAQRPGSCAIFPTAAMFAETLQAMKVLALEIAQAQVSGSTP
eukprot:m.62073 g.62073  ORF g.62073 m.62073 type:complete len:2764 (-) comp11893_c0_seq2:2602-10893(-)